MQGSVLMSHRVGSAIHRCRQLLRGPGFSVINTQRVFEVLNPEADIGASFVVCAFCVLRTAEGEIRASRVLREGFGLGGFVDRDQGLGRVRDCVVGSAELSLGVRPVQSEGWG